MDITDPAALREALSGFDAVVNCAAWTDVDGAERNEDGARRVNAMAVRDLTRACSEHGVWLFHISSDFVFSGDRRAPYSEAEPVSPISAYGRTKAEGEVFVLDFELGSVIRTSWLYGPRGHGFPRAILNRARQGVRFAVVDDQEGQPTLVQDAAERILTLVSWVTSGDAPAGLWHASNAGSTSRWHLATTLLELCGSDPELVIPAATRIEAGVARRPSFSALADDRGASYGLPPMREWREALTGVAPLLWTA